MIDYNTAHYTEEEALDNLLEDFDIPEEIYDSFLGGRHLTKKQAKRDLKEQLRKKFGAKWWKPGKLIKYRKEYKKEKSGVVKKALEDYQREKWKLREEKKDIKAEGKSRREEKENTEIGAASEPPKPNIVPSEKKDNKKMLLYGFAGLLVLVGIFFAVKKLM